MASVKIRPMTEEDISPIMSIEERSYGTHHWSEDSFKMELKNKLGNYFCACDEKTEEILGYCGYWLIFDEAHITTIAVNPEKRKSGTGELLLQTMIKHGYEEKAKWFTLEVRASNLPAISLYKKYGFDSLGVRKNYYHDNNEDALIMWTENIWFDKFKERFNQNLENYNNKTLK